MGQMVLLRHTGVIDEIWELDYLKFKVPVFRCSWVDVARGVRVDELGFTLVDFRRMGHSDEPFILASQARQVFYVTDPSNAQMSIVIRTRERYCNEENEEQFDVSGPTLVVPEHDVDINDDDVTFVRKDHKEGIVIEERKRKRSKN